MACNILVQGPRGRDHENLLNGSPTQSIYTWHQIKIHVVEKMGPELEAIPFSRYNEQLVMQCLYKESKKKVFNISFHSETLP